MRSQNELKVISAQLELLEERKGQSENTSEINIVINLCKAWMEEREVTPTSFRDLLKLCVKMADMCPDGVDCQSPTTVPVKEMTENKTASAGLENTNRKPEDTEVKVMEKILMRLDILEKAVSSLSSSNKVNEDSFAKVKKTIESVSFSLNEKLQENQQKAEQVRNEQSNQLKTLKTKLKGQGKKVKALMKSLQKMEDDNKERNEELVNDISTCNDVNTLLQSKFKSMSQDMKNVCNRYSQVENDVISMKSDLQVLRMSHESCQLSSQNNAKALQEQIEELIHDVSSCSSSVTSLESKCTVMSQDLESLHNSCKLKDSRASSISSTTFESCLIESMVQEHEIKLKQLETKVQMVKEQMNYCTVLQLQRQKTLRDVFKKYVQTQKPHVAKIAQIEYDILNLTKKCAVFKPNVGFIADNFTITRDIEVCKQKIESMDSQKVDENHQRNSGRILTCFPVVYSGNDDDYDSSSGIFRVRKDGLYLTCFHMTFYENPPSRVNLAFIIRAKDKADKIAMFYCFKEIDVVASKAHCMAFLNLSSGQELCLCTNQKCQIYALDSQFACVLLA